MKNYVVESYENYREENRLTTNHARRIEFINTVRILDEHIEDNSTILDCAAGAGIYAFYLADKGHKVTATDITPRHISQKRSTSGMRNNFKYGVTTIIAFAESGRYLVRATM